MNDLPQSQQSNIGAVEWHEESKIKIPDWCQIQK